MNDGGVMITKTRREHETISAVDVAHGEKATIRTIVRVPDIDNKQTIEIREMVLEFHRKLDGYNQLDAFDGKPKAPQTVGSPPRDVNPTPEAEITYVDPTTGEERPVPEDKSSIDYSLFAAAHIAEGAVKRWSERRLEGLEDHELSDALKFEFGDQTMIHKGSTVFPGVIIKIGVLVKGKRSPMLWHNVEPGAALSKNPTLRTKKLLALARDVLKIDRPKKKKGPKDNVRQKRSKN